MKVLKIKRANCPELEIVNPTEAQFESLLKSAIRAYDLHELVLLKYMDVPAVEAADFKSQVLSTI